MKYRSFKKYALIFTLIIINFQCKNIEKTVNQINQNAIKSDNSYQVLEYLSKQTAGRLPGTQQSKEAIEYVQKVLAENGADFLEVFEFYQQEGYETPTAFRNAMRVFRGGVITGGALADILVWDGDPEADLSWLATPDVSLRLIIKDGKVHKNTL